MLGPVKAQKRKKGLVSKSLATQKRHTRNSKNTKLNAVNALFFFAFAVGGSLLMSLVKVLFGEGTQGYGGALFSCRS